VRNAYQILVKKSEMEQSLGIFRHMCEDNIKMDLKGVSYEYVD
jgi:pentatricopeptide repeat protein